MIALGCDHGGFELKQEIIAYLKARKIEYKDFGCYDNKSVDYPVYAKLVGKAIQSGECEKGNLNLWNGNWYFDCSKQDERNPCGSLYRLLLC